VNEQVNNVNPSELLPAPEVEDNTRTKTSKLKPATPEDKTPTKRDLFKSLRSWLGLDTSEDKINSKMLELMANGVSPVNAYKQAQELCKGLASVECSESDFIAKVSEFPQLSELLASVHLESIEGVTLTRCGQCVSYHPASTGKDNNTEDNNTEDNNTEDNNRVKEVITNTVLGVECSVEMWYQFRRPTWSNWVLALRTQDLAKCLKSGRGAELLNAKRDFLNSFNRLKSLGVSDNTINSLLN